jgi:transcriptional regulator NrdR family protein
MTCPKCNGKIQVSDTVHNEKENEIMRKRDCRRCGYQFFTIEYEVIVNQKFLEEWDIHHRKRATDYYTNKGAKRNEN